MQDRLNIEVMVDWWFISNPSNVSFSNSTHVNTQILNTFVIDQGSEIKKKVPIHKTQQWKISMSGNKLKITHKNKLKIFCNCHALMKFINSWDFTAMQFPLIYFLDRIQFIA